MAVELVEIVNPNGRKGTVAKTSRAARVYKSSPATRVDPGVGPVEVLAVPSGNASTEEWRTYATDSRNPRALSSERADQMNRDELVAYFKSEED
jgi:hypothetical protein